MQPLPPVILELAQRLRSLRDAARLGQRELASRAGWTQP